MLKGLFSCINIHSNHIIWACSYGGSFPSIFPVKRDFRIAGEIIIDLSYAEIFPSCRDNYKPRGLGLCNSSPLCILSLRQSTAWYGCLPSNILVFLRRCCCGAWSFVFFSHFEYDKWILCMCKARSVSPPRRFDLKNVQQWRILSQHAQAHKNKFKNTAEKGQKLRMLMWQLNLSGILTWWEVDRVFDLHKREINYKNIDFNSEKPARNALNFWKNYQIIWISRKILCTEVVFDTVCLEDNILNCLHSTLLWRLPCFSYKWNIEFGAVCFVTFWAKGRAGSGLAHYLASRVKPG